MARQASIAKLGFPSKLIFIFHSATHHDETSRDTDAKLARMDHLLNRKISLFKFNENCKKSLLRTVNTKASSSNVVPMLELVVAEDDVPGLACNSKASTRIPSRPLSSAAESQSVPRLFGFNWDKHAAKGRNCVDAPDTRLNSGEQSQ